MPRLESIVIHCRDPYRLGPFWSLVTGLPIDPEDEKSLAAHTLEADESVLLGQREGPGVAVWLTPAEHLLPIGRQHLDIRATPAEREAILAAGASVVREEERWTVMADPEGNEFCLFTVDVP
jgi:hypothetical protein